MNDQEQPDVLDPEGDHDPESSGSSGSSSGLAAAPDARRVPQMLEVPVGSTPRAGSASGPVEPVPHAQAGGAKRSRPSRWIVVADTAFLPAHGGGEREHLGFVQAALAHDLVAALILPVDDDPAAHGRSDDLPALRRLVAPAPVLTVPRRRSLRSALSRRPYVVQSRPAPDGLAALVRAAAPDADGVVIFHYKSSGLGRRLALELGLPVVLRQHNLEGPYHHALADAARVPKSWAMHAEAWRIDVDERRLEHAGWLSGIADISASDAQVRAARSTVTVAHVPTFALARTDPGAEPRRWARPDSPVVTFVGALDVATNHDALTWFAEHVWGRIRAAVPDARWRVVGRRPDAQVRELVDATSGAELHADVADPVDFLLTSSVAVNPAVSGSGVNIKLVEYLSVGVPVVSTTRGMAGIGLRHDSELLVADDAREFAAAVVRLLTARHDAERLGAGGRETAERILDADASLEALAALFDGTRSASRSAETTERRPRGKRAKFRGQ